MEINQQTTQQELEQLYKAVVQREFLRNTPLNIKMLLRYTVLFLLFPGMRFGFRAGLLLTAVFSLGLLVLLLCGRDDWAVTAACVWFACGILVLARVCVGVWRRATATRAARMQELPAEASLPRNSKDTPQQHSLYWQRDRRYGRRFTTSYTADVPQSGIYAYILHVTEGMRGGRIVTHGQRGTCVVYATGGGKSEQPFQALILYRLAAGRHELRWSIDTAADSRPAATLTQMNRI